MQCVNCGVRTTIETKVAAEAYGWSNLYCTAVGTLTGICPECYTSRLAEGHDPTPLPGEAHESEPDDDQLTIGRFPHAPKS